ncbi:MAG: hypothetical protein K6F49_12795 [Saccharofermentans sp.]|nr:hypothetical protein [Saccharofermentans sp.]
MNKRTRKAICVVIATCLTASMFAGCNISFGKTKAQKELVERYLNACIEFEYRDASSCVKGSGDAFQDVDLEPVQQEICELCLSRAQFEVEKIENDRALVKFIVPDIDRILRRENVASLEVDDLDDLISDSDKMLEEEFEFDFVKGKKEWLIDADSTEDFAEFISEFGLDVSSTLGLGSRAVELFDSLMTCLAQGNIDAADDLMNGGSSYSGASITSYYDPEAAAAITNVYSLLFGAITYDVEVASCSESSVVLEVSGTRVAFYDSMANILSTNETIAVPYIKEMILYYVRLDAFDYSTGDYTSMASELLLIQTDFYIQCMERAQSEEFEFTVEISIDEHGNMSMDPYVMESIIGSPQGAADVSQEFYEQALEELLEEGEITQEQYEELLLTDPIYFM